LTKIVHDFPPLQDYAIAMSEMLADIDTITIVYVIDWMYGLEEACAGKRDGCEY